MAITGLNLSNLDSLNDSDAPEEQGKPLLLNIADVIEDPDQPREVFDPVALQELADAIKARGVKSPISVKSKNDDGKYIINHGARRYRASIMAGKTAIPAHIDDDHESLDQLLENELRDGLKTFETAKAVARELAKPGVTTSSLGDKTGKGKAWVSKFAAIAAAPEIFKEHQDKLTDYSAVYELVTAHKKMPDEVSAFVAQAETISRATVGAFLRPAQVTIKPQGNGQPPGEGNSNAGDGAGDGGQPPASKNEPGAGSEQKPGGGKSPNAGGEGKAQRPGKNAPPLPPSDLESLFAVHAAGQEVEAILSGLKSADQEALGKPLAKLHKQGATTTDKDVYSVLVSQLKAGAFDTDGAGLYRMNAFVLGVVTRNEKVGPVQILETVLMSSDRFVKAQEE